MTGDALKIARTDLSDAVREGILSGEQAERLWTTLAARPAAGAAFGVSNVAYYLGAMIVISAMGWFMTEAWEQFGGAGICAIALAYAGAFASAGGFLWRRGRRVPGGLLVTMSVAMTPLAVYGLERALGLWPQGDPGAYRGFHLWVKGSWFAMEVATIGAGAVALRFVRFPFITAPIAFVLWYMSMDLTPLLVGRIDFTWNERLWISLGFGAAMCLAASIIDRRGGVDFAFWGHLFGALAAWGGLTLMESHGEAGRLGYALVNVALIFAAARLDRRVYAVLGGIGTFVYLEHLAEVVFHDSLLFPFALSGIGLLIIALAFEYEKLRALSPTSGTRAG